MKSTRIMSVWNCILHYPPHLSFCVVSESFRNCAQSITKLYRDCLIKMDVIDNLVFLIVQYNILWPRESHANTNTNIGSGNALLLTELSTRTKIDYAQWGPVACTSEQFQRDCQKTNPWRELYTLIVIVWHISPGQWAKADFLHYHSPRVSFVSALFRTFQVLIGIHSRDAFCR